MPPRPFRLGIYPVSFLRTLRAPICFHCAGFAVGDGEPSCPSCTSCPSCFRLAALARSDDSDDSDDCVSI